MRPNPVEEGAGRPVEDLADAAAVVREEVRIEEALSHTLGAQPGRLRREGQQQPGGDCRHTDRHGLG